MLLIENELYLCSNCQEKITAHWAAPERENKVIYLIYLMFFSWKEKHNKYFICLLFHKNRNHGYIRYISKYLRKDSLLLRILTEPAWHQADKSKPLSVKAWADRSKNSGEPTRISGKSAFPTKPPYFRARRIYSNHLPRSGPSPTLYFRAKRTVRTCSKVSKACFTFLDTAKLWKI